MYGALYVRPGAADRGVQLAGEGGGCLQGEDLQTLLQRLQTLLQHRPGPRLVSLQHNTLYLQHDDDVVVPDLECVGGEDE